VELTASRIHAFPTPTPAPPGISVPAAAKLEAWRASSNASFWPALMPSEEILVGDRVLSRHEDDPDGPAVAQVVEEIFFFFFSIL